MARDLVTHRGVGERADAIWKELQAQRPNTFGESAPLITEPTGSELAVPPPMALEEIPELSVPNEVIPGEALPTLAQFGAAVRRTTRRPAYRNDDQLSLAF
jgi:hypothetical protein